KMTEVCEFLLWDSEFFGHKIARVVGHRLDLQTVDAILKWCEAQDIECLYFLADADNPPTVRLAEDHGFRQVDIRVTLACDIGGRRVLHKDGSEKGINVRSALSKDIPVLQAIAHSSHRDTRFFSDPCFPRESCEALYETWIKNSCEGYADVVLLAEIGKQPVGYVSCHLPGSTPHGRIGLVGVATQARGQGIGRMLVEHSLQWFAEQEVNSVTVVTQGRNVESQRLYQRCGFLSHSVQLWYHKWMLNSGKGEIRESI
ncbi:MAG: GNAT family N-acetyltransferase, partial [Gammaproteobacteria bacterium]|nr:GNAT family N-acetyltransferase [Gammaproteobacteria bacterium]